jgi:hypothetical protein
VWPCVNADPHKLSNKTAIIVSVCMGAVALVALIVTFFVVKKLMKKISIMRDFQYGKHVEDLSIDTPLSMVNYYVL